MENVVTAHNLDTFYRGKIIFVTGHTGFKGSWLTLVLESLGANVKGYALAPEQKGGLFDYLKPVMKGNSVISDIRDRVSLQNELENFVPDLVFHLAAQPLVRRSYSIPSETFDINVTGTANLLEAVSRLNNRCSIIVITTDKVYRNKEQDVLYKESDELGGYDPYSASKACCELVCDSFRNSFFNPASYSQHQKSLATARAGNVIGGGDWSRDRLIPDIVNAIFTKKELNIRYPHSVRPWQHVLEAIAGYLVLGKKLHDDPVKFSKAYNFGPLPGDHLTVKDVVEYAISHLGSGIWNDISESEQPHESGLLKLDVTAARVELNWDPKLDARTAIKWTLDWYMQKEDGRLDYARKQVEQYFSL